MASPDAYPPVQSAIAEEGSLRVSRAWLAFFTTLLNQSAAAGPGNVVGPASATDGQIALFNGATGKILKAATGSGIVKATSGVYSTIALPADATKYLDGTGAFTVPAGTGINQLTGDVTAGPGSGSQAATIANDAVTYAKMQNVSAASRLLGRGSASGAGDVQELTLDSSLALTGTVLSASGGFLTSTTNLTNAQLLALPTGPFTLLAAPGLGFWINPISGYISATTASGAYTNIDAAAFWFVSIGANVQLSYVPNDVLITNGSATNLSDLLGSTTNRLVRLVPYQRTEGVDSWGPIPDVITRSAVENVALTTRIDNNGMGAFGGGNAANSVRIVIRYTVEAV